MENINIVTNRPIVEEYDLTSTDPSEYYYYANGKGRAFFDKLKNTWVRAKDSGLIDSARTFLTNKGQSNVPEPVMPPPPPPPPPKGMSKGLKIGLIVGGVVVVGVVLYFLLRSNKTSGQVTNVGATGV
jgi:hypothetical protein